MQQGKRTRLIESTQRWSTRRQLSHADMVSLAQHRVGVPADTHKHHEFFDS